MRWNRNQDDPRRRLLIKALAAGFFSSALCGRDTSAQALGARPARLPPGKSIYRIEGDVRVDGRPATVDSALQAAAAILDDANMPLVYGLGNSTCESQRAAMMLAEQIGAVIDSHTSLTYGPGKIAGQLTGKLTCTLGEVKNRADFVVYWGTNPVESHPRHFNKFALRAKGKFVPRGRRDRTMVLVDVRETPSARASDQFLQIRSGADLEVLTTLRALVNNRTVDRGLVAATGLTCEQLVDLAERMKRARFGVFFFGSGLTMTRGKHANVFRVVCIKAEWLGYKITKSPVC